MRLGVILGFGLLLLACSPPQATGEAPPPTKVATEPTAIRPLAPSGAPAKAFPPPDRHVADIVSPVWNSPSRREAAREIEQIVERMSIAPGMTVADIGAGDGFVSVRLAPIVGPRGRVIAQDVMPDYLRRLDAEARRRGLSNITLALGDPHDPRLPARSLDAAILIHMYHEIEQPYGLLYNLAAALKPGAKVGVEDLERATNRHGIPAALLRCEFEAVGYTYLSSAPMKGDLGYFSIFIAPTKPTPPDHIKPCR